MQPQSVRLLDWWGKERPYSVIHRHPKSGIHQPDQIRRLNTMIVGVIASTAVRW
jgi:hypothetical protein